MDIAIFHPWLKEKGGAEKVVLEYAKRSQNNVTILTPFYDEENTFEEFKNCEIQKVGWQGEPKGLISKLVKYGLGGALTKLDIEEYDAVIFSNSGISTSFAIRNNQKLTLEYCHTPLRAALPEFKDSYKKEINRILQPFFGITTELFKQIENYSWKKFDHIFVNSKNTLNRVLQRNLEKPENITILNPGADVEKNKSESYEKYFLYPTRFRRYKRHKLAIKAFKKADLDDFKLILAGSSQETEYLEELEKLTNEKISIEKDVSEKRWNELYSNAYTILFCAKNEDWGIIPIEAASYSKPVISVNEGGPTESIIDNKTGFLVTPTPKAFSDKMNYLAENPFKVKKMGEKARENSMKYTWKKFSEKLDKKIKYLQTK